MIHPDLAPFRDRDETLYVELDGAFLVDSTLNTHVSDKRHSRSYAIVSSRHSR
jgi:hypothetical protein